MHFTHIRTFEYETKSFAEFLCPIYKLLPTECLPMYILMCMNNHVNRALPCYKKKKGDRNRKPLINKERNTTTIIPLYQKDPDFILM